MSHHNQCDQYILKRNSQKNRRNRFKQLEFDFGAEIHELIEPSPTCKKAYPGEQ